MGARERERGARGEREVVQLVREHGWPGAERSSNGRAQVGRGDIALGPEFTSIDVKFCEKTEPWKWWRQAERDADGRMPVVAFRRSRSPWLAIVELDELLELLAMRERS